MIIFLLLIVIAKALRLEIDDKTGGFELYEDEIKYFASPENWKLSVNGVSSSLNVKREKDENDFLWYDEAGHDVMKTSYNQISNDVIVFETCFLQDLKQTNTSSNITESKESALSNFPSFDVTSSDERLGFFGYYNQMLGGMFDGTKYGVWGDTDDVPVGTMGGPIVSFAKKGKSILMGPYENVMTLNAVYDKKEKVLSYGLLGSFTSVPKGTCASVSVVVADTPSDCVKRYGSALLSLHGKESVWNRESTEDPTVHYLTYSTDNGAYYYYNSAPFHDEQTAVENVLLSEKLPYGGVLLDSWWYPKDKKGGVTSWTATNTTFPRGLESFNEKVQLPIVAHNRYWSSENVYAKQNGGQYDFIVETERAIPIEQSFWNDLIENSTKWGLVVYEQDWLHNEWESLQCTLENVTLASTWLSQMGHAAARANVSIQYCMAYARFALYSASVPAVDQIRVSDDYAVDLTRKYNNTSVNLYVGPSSLLAGSLGLAPSKDVFWSSSSIEESNPYSNTTFERYPELEALVSVLTAGPVACGDRIDTANVSLIMRTCGSDGILLRPSWPAIPVNEYYIFKAFRSGGPNGHLSFAPSEVGKFTWWNILGIEMHDSYVLKIGSIIGQAETGSFFMYEIMNHELSAVEFVSSNLTIPICGRENYFYRGLVPVQPYPKYTVLGELDKFVPVSPVRFSDVQYEDKEMIMKLNGEVDETVSVTLVRRRDDSGKLERKTVSCTVTDNDEASSSLKKNGRRGTCTIHVSY